MKYIYIILIPLLFVTKVLGQDSNVINKIEIYALNYDALYITNITKKDIKKMYKQYVRILDDVKIQESNLDKYIKKMKSNIVNEPIPQDYRAILIIHMAKKKKETYYIASSNAGIVDEKGVLYKNDTSLISSIYSFLPSYFFYNPMPSDDNCIRLGDDPYN